MTEETCVAGIPYTIVHSKRKTMAVQVTRDGRVVVRCPMRVSDKRAREFAESHEEWIIRHYQQVKDRQAQKPVMTLEEIMTYRAQARRVLM